MRILLLTILFLALQARCEWELYQGVLSKIIALKDGFGAPIPFKTYTVSGDHLVSRVEVPTIFRPDSSWKSFLTPEDFPNTRSMGHDLETVDIRGTSYIVSRGQLAAMEDLNRAYSQFHPGLNIFNNPRFKEWFDTLVRTNSNIEYKLRQAIPPADHDVVFGASHPVHSESVEEEANNMYRNWRSDYNAYVNSVARTRNRKSISRWLGI